MFHLSEKAIGSIATSAFMTGYFRAVWVGVIINFIAMTGPGWLRGLLFGGGTIWALAVGVGVYAAVWALSLPGVETKALASSRKESGKYSPRD